MDELIAVVLAGDRECVAESIREARPGVVDRAIAARPALVVQAAAAGRLDAVRLLVELGFDVNAKGRSDLANDQPWQTALHEAVAVNDTDMVTLLLASGADPDLRDHRFDATPLGWAEHFENDALVEQLRAVTGGVV